MQKARIFDRDDGLFGEIGDQFNLLLIEQLDLLSKNAKCADHYIVLE